MAEKHRYNRDRARTKLLLLKFIIPIRSYLNQLFPWDQSRLPSVSACKCTKNIWIMQVISQEVTLKKLLLAIYMPHEGV